MAMHGEQPPNPFDICLARMNELGSPTESSAFLEVVSALGELSSLPTMQRAKAAPKIMASITKAFAKIGGTPSDAYVTLYVPNARNPLAGVPDVIDEGNFQLCQIFHDFILNQLLTREKNVAPEGALLGALDNLTNIWGLQTTVRRAILQELLPRILWLHENLNKYIAQNPAKAEALLQAPHISSKPFGAAQAEFDSKIGAAKEKIEFNIAQALRQCSLKNTDNQSESPQVALQAIEAQVAAWLQAIDRFQQKFQVGSSGVLVDVEHAASTTHEKLVVAISKPLLGLASFNYDVQALAIKPIAHDDEAAKPGIICKVADDVQAKLAVIKASVTAKLESLRLAAATYEAFQTELSTSYPYLRVGQIKSELPSMAKPDSTAWLEAQIETHQQTLAKLEEAIAMLSEPADADKREALVARQQLIAKSIEIMETELAQGNPELLAQKLLATNEKLIAQRHALAQHELARQKKQNQLLAIQAEENQLSAPIRHLVTLRNHKRLLDSGDQGRAHKHIPCNDTAYDIQALAEAMGWNEAERIRWEPNTLNAQYANYWNPISYWNMGWVQVTGRFLPKEWNPAAGLLSSMIEEKIAQLEASAEETLFAVARHRNTHEAIQAQLSQEIATHERSEVNIRKEIEELSVIQQSIREKLTREEQDRDQKSQQNVERIIDDFQSIISEIPIWLDEMAISIQYSNVAAPVVQLHCNHGISVARTLGQENIISLEDLIETIETKKQEILSLYNNLSKDEYRKQIPPQYREVLDAYQHKMAKMHREFMLFQPLIQRCAEYLEHKQNARSFLANLYYYLKYTRKGRLTPDQAALSAITKNVCQYIQAEPGGMKDLAKKALLASIEQGKKYFRRDAALPLEALKDELLILEPSPLSALFAAPGAPTHTVEASSAKNRRSSRLASMRMFSQLSVDTTHQTERDRSLDTTSPAPESSTASPPTTGLD